MKKTKQCAHGEDCCAKDEMSNHCKISAQSKFCFDYDSGKLILGVAFNGDVAGPVVHLVHMSYLMNALEEMIADLQNKC